MSLRTRSKTTKDTSTTTQQPQQQEEQEEHDKQQLLIEKEEAPPPPPPLSQRAITQTLTSTAHLANLLPTGTLLAFHLLTPIFTSNGSCDSVTRLLTLILLLALASSCFLASFTDSLTYNGRLYYGLATPTGMWLFDYTEGNNVPDLTKYRLRLIDSVHGVLSVLVFIAVALRDRNIVNCFYPDPEKETQEALDIIPIGIGLISSLLFVIFPTRRHGIGYPVTSQN